MSLGQTLQEETAEKVAENPDREKEAAAAANPSVMVWGQTAAGNDAMAAIGSGSVKTTWKYSVGNNSARRCSNHFSRAAPWHLGQ